MNFNCAKMKGQQEARLIKYLGSKRTLVPQIEKLAKASQAKSVLDLFTGTTRVARALKQNGMHVTAVDLASYSYAMAKAWIELDANSYDAALLQSELRRLNELPGEAGYFTETFCVNARFFQPKNGERIDAIRNAIESDHRGSWLYYPLLTSLLLASDRVDSTTGLQMAFLKQWAARSWADMELRDPELIAGHGEAKLGDALELASQLPPVDLAYLDPPYNQHRYFANYHIWETLIRWDQPESYGIAQKRIDVRSDETKSAFNSKRTLPAALEKVVTDVQAETLILSYNNESWLSREDLVDICASKGEVKVLEFDYKRYVGSLIGVYNQKGERVGEPKHQRNLEYLVLAGPKSVVRAMVEAVA